MSSAAMRVLEESPLPAPLFRQCAVLDNRADGDIYRRLILHAPEMTERSRAGQFVMLSIPETSGCGAVLPRPMAVHRRRDEALEVVFAVRGRGTSALASLPPRSMLGVTGPLGRGFTVPDTDTAGPVLVIGRGIGVCSVMGVLEDAAAHGRSTVVVLSGRHRAAVVGLSDIAEIGIEDVTVVTDETGTSSPEALRRSLLARFAGAPPAQTVVCGSKRLESMAASLSAQWGTPLQVALEAHMACGLGYCHGCAMPATDSPGEAPLICVDGPVFEVQPG